MKNNFNISKYLILTDIESLSMKERIGIILFPSIIITCMLLYIFIDSHEVYILLLLLGIYVFFIGLGYPVIYFEKYDEQYGFNSKIRMGNTYQIISKTISYLVPGLIIIILAVGLILDDMTKASLIAFAFILPFWALFFRVDVFNDDSSIDNGEIILGYNPGYYGLLSLFLGIYGYINVNDLLNSNFNLAIMLFIITIIIQTLFLIPDQLNKVLFFEVRRKKGFLMYICLLILCYAILCFIITGNNLFNGINIDLSLEGIIRKTITWGAGIILAWLFVNQIKNMDG